MTAVARLGGSMNVQACNVSLLSVYRFPSRAGGPDTGLWLVESDHVTRTLASDWRREGDWDRPQPPAPLSANGRHRRWDCEPMGGLGHTPPLRSVCTNKGLVGPRPAISPVIIDFKLQYNPTHGVSLFVLTKILDQFLNQTFSVKRFFVNKLHRILFDISKNCILCATLLRSLIRGSRLHEWPDCHGRIQKLLRTFTSINSIYFFYRTLRYSVEWWM